MSHISRNCLVSLLCLSLLLGIGCQRDPEQEQSNQEQTNNPPTENGSAMNLEKTSYGKLSDDREVDLYTCTNANGLSEVAPRQLQRCSCREAEDDKCFGLHVLL